MKDLPAPPLYFPPVDGRYEVAPGVMKFGRDCGAGARDKQYIQIDRLLHQYRQVKLTALAERYDKYVCQVQLTPEVEAQVNAFLVDRLITEHPQWFSRNTNQLHCRLSAETLDLDHLTLDALARQIQEDLAIVSSANNRYWVSALHLCFPNRWAAEDKIGGTFSEVHQPVAGMEQMNQRGDLFMRMMVAARDGLVRFAWGLTFDDRLNLHPAEEATPFDPAHPQAWLRVERQTIRGFPEVGAALFTIRTYLYAVVDLSKTHQRQLASAVRSMTEASARYKGLADCREQLIDWLNALAE